MKISKECQIMRCHNGENRAQQPISSRKQICDHNESAGHKVALKILAEADKETLGKLCLKTLSLVKK
jgi:hypothetical protein